MIPTVGKEWDYSLNSDVTGEWYMVGLISARRHPQYSR